MFAEPSAHDTDTEEVIAQYAIAARRKLVSDPFRQLLRIARRKAREASGWRLNQGPSEQMGREKVPRFLQPPSLRYAGFSGPWLEEFFLRNYTAEYRQGALYLPILWDNFFAHAQGHTYLPSEFAVRFRAMWRLLNQLARTDQAYFTLQGIYDFPIWNWHRFPRNILVLAGNGYGDIAIPLLKGDRAFRRKSKDLLVSFMGRTETDPIRSKLRETLGNQAHFGSGPSWEDVMARSHFSLCPRGLGPTSFRLFEALSLTSIPVYIWQRWRWLPYEQDLDWSEFSLVLKADEVPDLPRQLNAISVERRAQMQDRIAALYDRYFSYAGTCRWIADRMSNVAHAEDAYRLSSCRTEFRF